MSDFKMKLSTLLVLTAFAFLQKEAFGEGEGKTSSRLLRSLSIKKNNIYKLDHFIELIEKIQRHPLMSGNNQLKVISNHIRSSFGYRNQKWDKLLGKSDPLPDGILTTDEKRVLRGMLDHGFSGRQERGVVNTPHGDVAMGRVITGICAGMNRNEDLVLQEIYGLSSNHMDNLYAATIAGDIAQTGLMNKNDPSKPLFGPGGTWSPNTECPEVFTSLTSIHSAATDAEIVGGIDGFLLALKVEDRGSVRLGQLLRMYYYKHDQEKLDKKKKYAACKRFDTFQQMAGKRELIDQTMLSMYAVKKVWHEGVDFSGIQTGAIPKLAHTTTEHFFTYLKNLTSGGAACPKIDEDCELPANLVFVMDESGSIGSINYEVEKDFVKNITDVFDISPYQTRVAVIEFASYVQYSIKLNEYASKSRFKCAVNGLAYTGGWTYTSTALQAAHDILQKAQSDPRHKKEPQIIVLLTDGKSNGPVLKPVVKSVKENITDLTIISVGIGNYDKSELDMIATSPNHVLTVTDFSKLVTLVKSLLTRTCKAPVVLKPLTIGAQSDEGGEGGKAEAKVSGYLSPGKARYFTLPKETLFKTENISIEVTPKYGSVYLYLSRTNQSPGPDNYDFKIEVADADASISRKKRSTIIQGKSRTLQFYNLCKGYNETTCPPLYFAVVGKNSSQSCSDLDCSLPSQIKFELKTVQIIPKKENRCYFELEATKMYKAKDISVTVSAVNDTISYYISRVPENPDLFNNSYKIKQIVAGLLKKITINSPCKGYNKATCPSLYFFFRGSQLMCHCTGRNCTLPSQVDIKVNFEDEVKVEVKEKPTVCYHQLNAQQLYGHRMVEIKVSPVKDTITLYTSRVNKYPDESNYTQKMDGAALGETKSFNITHPCKGFDRSTCPHLYLTFTGNRLLCNCTGEAGKQRCTLPDEVSIIFTKVQIIPKKENRCYFELEATKMYKAKDISVTVSAVNDTISYYISRVPENPDLFNNSYKIKQIVAGLMKKITINSPCKGYNKATCPSLYFFFRGSQLMCHCTGRNCTLPSQVDIKVNFEDEVKVEVKEKPTVCYHQLNAQQLYGHRMVEIKVSPVKDTITLYTSRVNKYPDESNYTQKIDGAALGETKSFNITHPCKGFDRSTCPHLYLTFTGNRLLCNCTGEAGKQRCTLPDEVSIIFTKGAPSSSALKVHTSMCLIIIAFVFSLLFK